MALHDAVGASANGTKKLLKPQDKGPPTMCQDVSNGTVSESSPSNYTCLQGWNTEWTMQDK